MSLFDEAKQRIKELSFTIHRDNLSEEGRLLISPAKHFLLDYDVLAVLGDLHHAFEDLEGKCGEYAKLVARQVEQYAEECAEAQKTLKELLETCPRPIWVSRGVPKEEMWKNHNELMDKLKEYREKAEKLLETSK